MRDHQVQNAWITQATGFAPLIRLQISGAIRI